jgi:SAM-dependent methyltransferase
MEPAAYIEMADTQSRHWWFTARRKILVATIARLNLPRDAAILEIGCGPGGNLDMLATFGKVSALEMDADARAMAHANTRHAYDIRAGSCPGDIPFPDGQFDLICILDVLEHIDDDHGTLVALRNLLRPEGRILVTVPASPWLWGAHDEFLHHKRRYSSRTLRGEIARAGLHAGKLSHFNTLLFPLAAASRLKDRWLHKRQASGTSIPATPVNWLFGRIFASERGLLQRVNLPFGVSLLAILKKAD